MYINEARPPLFRDWFDSVNLSATYKETVGTKDVQVDGTFQKSYLDGRLNTSTFFQNSAEK